MHLSTIPRLSATGDSFFFLSIFFLVFFALENLRALYFALPRFMFCFFFKWGKLCLLMKLYTILFRYTLIGYLYSAVFIWSFRTFSLLQLLYHHF